jgi:hypothetical protein
MRGRGSKTKPEGKTEMKTQQVVKASVIGAAALLGLPGVAVADTYNYTFTGADYGSSAWTTHATWSGGSGGCFNADTGLAAVDGSPAQRLWLTANGTYINGNAWLNTPVQPQQNWSVTMNGEVSFPGGIGAADGMGIVFQTAGTSPDISTSAAEGISNMASYGTSVSIWVDTFTNSGQTFVNALRINTGNSLGNVVNISGDTDLNSSLHLVNAGDWEKYTLTVSYTASTHNLQWTLGSFSGTLGSTGSYSGNITEDLSTVFTGNQAATVGFVAATGAGGENHDVFSTSINAQPVPEPSTLALSGLGLLGVLATLRRRA